MAFNGGQRDDGVANSNNNNNNGSCCLCCCLCCSAQWSETVIKVKLTISERFTVDISHDSLVMRFSRIKDAAAVPSLSLFLSLCLCLPPSHAAQCNRITNICLVASRLALTRIGVRVSALGADTLVSVATLSWLVATTANAFVKRKLIKIMSFRANVTRAALRCLALRWWMSSALAQLSLCVCSLQICQIGTDREGDRQRERETETELSCLGS